MMHWTNNTSLHNPPLENDCLDYGQRVKLNGLNDYTIKVINKGFMAKHNPSNSAGFLSYLCLKFIYRASDLTMCLWKYGLHNGLSNNKYMKMYNGNGKKVLNIYHQNIPGVTMSDEMVKINLEIILDKYKPDVLFISEISPDRIENLNFLDYELVRGIIDIKDVKEPRMCVLVSQRVRHKVIEIKTQIPCVCIEINNTKVIGLYREWSNIVRDPKDPKRFKTSEYNNPQKRLKTLTSVLRRLSGSITIVGDFNWCAIDTIRNENPTQRKNDSLRKIWDDDVGSRGYVQLIKKFTRFNKKDRATCLDHIWTNNNKNISTTYNLRAILTDHHLIGFRLILNRDARSPKINKIRKLQNIRDIDFYRTWEALGPLEILYEHNPQVKVELFTKNLLTTIEHLAPVKVSKHRTNFMPWWNNVIQSHKEYADWLLDKYLSTKDKEDERKFKLQSNRLRKAMKYARDKYFEEKYDCLSELNGQKKAWNYMLTDAALRTDTEKQIMLQVEGKGLLNTDALCADELNVYFKAKVKKLEEQTRPSIEKCEEYAREYVSECLKRGTNSPMKSFNFRQVSTTEVLEIIKSLNNTGAIGVDQIPIKIIKRFSWILCVYIRDIINTCIIHSVYPSAWKHGLIRPLPKKGDLLNPKNWRPIVLNSNLSKCLEKALNYQLKSHLEEMGVLSETQHAYRNNKSCLSAWIEIDTHVQRARDKGKVCALMCTDQSAAFNLVKAEIIMAKLKAYGLEKHARAIIKDYLTGRKTQTVIGNHRSPEITLDSGVGEGSIVGPLFFISVLADVEVVALRAKNSLKNKGKEVEIFIISYADDVSAIIVTDDEESMQDAVDTLIKEFEEYFSSAGLSMNPSKSELIVFRNRGQYNKIVKQRDLYVAGQKEADKVKLLGVTVTSEYKFTEHAKIVCDKLTYKAAALHRIARHVKPDLLRMAADSLLRGTLSYALEIYGRDKLIRKTVQKAYNRGIRTTTCSETTASIAPLLHKLGWLNMNCQYKLSQVTMLFRLMRTGFSRAAYDVLVRGQLKVSPEVKSEIERVKKLKIDWKPRVRAGLDAWINVSVQVFNDLDAFKYTALILGNKGENKVSYAEAEKNLRDQIIKKFENGNIN